MTYEPQPIQPELPAVPPLPVVPAATPSKIETLLKSRKFWAALIGLVLIVLKGYRPDFPITEDQLTGIVVVLVGYILGTAVEDSAHPTPPSAG